ncbi:MAG: hypothetical protein JW892_14245 [Anaerolineae bacterium]|nr:hypothetical protein [Anaerolineae bacterium]
MPRYLSKFSLLAILLLTVLTGRVKAQSPVVHAVLLYSPSCGHCHKVMEEVLPPLRERYGAQLEILEVNVQEPEGSTVYQAALETYKPAVRGVPMLVIGEDVLVGSVQIPERLPELIEYYLQGDGVAWPSLPKLPGVPESALPPTPTPVPASDAIMHLLYFQSPSCSGCRQFENEVLAQLRSTYDDRLQVTTVNTTDAAGRKLYEAMVASYKPALEGVPAIVIGETMLVGNRDVPEKLPALIERAAVSGGALLPEAPALTEYFAATPTSSPTPLPAQSKAPSTKTPWPMLGIAALALAAIALVIFRIRR